MLKIEKIILKNKIVDKDNYFEIGYCEELKIYMMHVFVSWIASYYKIKKIITYIKIVLNHSIKNMKMKSNKIIMFTQKISLVLNL